MACSHLLLSILLVVFLAAAPAQAKYAIKELNTTITNGTMTFHARIWYPVSASADDASGTTSSSSSSAAAAAPPTTFPIISFAHCLFGGDGWYDYVVQTLVPAGYIFASTGFHDFFTADAMQMSRTQVLMRTTVRAMGQDPTSPLYGIVGNISALMGHSLGGSSSLLTAELAPPGDFVSVVTLSACMVKDVKAVKLPLLVLTGTHDCICPAKSNSIPVYDLAGSACKMLGNINNATHCNFAQFTVLPDLVDTACTVVEKATGEVIGCGNIKDKHIPVQQQFQLVSRYVLPYFEWTLKGAKDARVQLLDDLKQDNKTGVTQVLQHGCDVL